MRVRMLGSTHLQSIWTVINHRHHTSQRTQPRSHLRKKKGREGGKGEREESEEGRDEMT